MQGTPRWAHICLGILNAVVLSTLLYLVVSGLIVGRPWWVILGPALALPEIARGGLSEFGDLQSKGRANHRATERTTRTLAFVGMLVIIFGAASM